ncbi:MAG: metalloregulator ArsR/SmtB family transcription factor [Persephonella sp.]|nr:metalloregulator ArsR/SmtB family transcription factor [Persephonella sp.]
MNEKKLKQIYYALSDEIRLKILKLLSDNGELCVYQLLPVLNISQPNLSFHLRILRDTDLVKSEKRGKWVFYSLDKENPILLANLEFIKSIKLDKTPSDLSCVT